ncbi:MAG: hypothetical protein HC851_17395 [Acaryochloris sp. RU_4_1]|nr:hypothetical protein [Acaryochloris sp. RU_4_1]NJR56847.1 hypothetical protein [Acaryochloris sp. CRU_2_0]
MVYLSPGQERLREIVVEHYPIYKNYVDRGEYSNHRYEFSSTVSEAFQSDSLITQDYITGQHCNDLKVSRNYLAWQTKKAGSKWGDWEYQGKTPGNIRLDKHYSELEGYFYEVGYNICYFLMCLYEGRPLPEMGFVFYYVQEGVLEHGADGRHRTLSHVLYGEPVINTRFHYMVETEPDPILNRCLLKLEKFFKEISETPEFIHSDKHHVRRSRMRFETSIDCSGKEMEDIKTFCQDTSDEEWDQIRRIMLHCIINEVYVDHPFIFGNTVKIGELVEFSNDIREIKGLRPLNTLCLKIKNRLPAWRDEVSQLERLLLDLRDFEEEDRQKYYKSLENKNLNSRSL